VSTQQQPTSPPVDIEKAIGQRVRARREEQGFSQAHLGRLTADYGMPMNQPMVYKLENGMRPLRVNEVYVLALVLDVSMDDLLMAPNPDSTLGKLEARYDAARNAVLKDVPKVNEAHERVDKAGRAVALAEHDQKAAVAMLEEVIPHWDEVNEKYIEARAALEKARRIERDQWSQSRKTPEVE
jgi:transcriptional regulator with XRE-family HTH domain